jgi:hypothetical protein
LGKNEMKKNKLILYIGFLFFSICNITYAAGSWLFPFSQEELVKSGITDPNAWVKSDTQQYDLRWGTLDKNGKKYADKNTEAKRTFEQPLSYYGKTITSANDPTKGPTVYTPNAEVKAAWTQGWTGKGVNILNIDFYPSSYGDKYGKYDENHGINTMMLIDQIVPGATKYGFDLKDIKNWTIYNVVYDDGRNGKDVELVDISTAKDINGKKVKLNWFESAKTIDVVNISHFDNFFTGFIQDKGVKSNTDFDIIAQLLGSKNFTQHGWGEYPKDMTSLVNLKNAVIVYAAGDGDIDIKHDKLRYVDVGYLYDKYINPRLLIVGATKSDGTPSNKTELLPNSNTAGNNPMIADRFVVANGSAPYAADAMINGINSDTSPSTNYATARVTAMVAILRQKFPKLSAEQASNIILDRARTDTIVNYQPNIHGKGEVSLSRALAPVGKLR